MVKGTHQNPINVENVRRIIVSLWKNCHIVFYSYEVENIDYSCDLQDSDHSIIPTLCFINKVGISFSALPHHLSMLLDLTMAIVLQVGLGYI